MEYNVRIWILQRDKSEMRAQAVQLQSHWRFPRLAAQVRGVSGPSTEQPTRMTVRRLAGPGPLLRSFPTNSIGFCKNANSLTISFVCSLRKGKKERLSKGIPEVGGRSLCGSGRSLATTCFDHNSSKSTNFSASRLSLERSRGDKAVGAL